MKKKLFWKRSISMLLSVLMVVSVIQFVGVTTVQAAPTNATSYITMPITIRDFAADGMLFEFNQVGATGTAGAVSTSTYTIYSFATDYNSWINGHANGLFLYKYADITGNGAWGAGYGHLMIVCDSSGNIVKVVPKGTAKGTWSNTKNIMSSGYYVVWCSGESSEYSSLSVITDNNKGDYNITYSGSTLTVKAVGAGNVYNQADTAGFSLLATDSTKDHIHSLKKGDTTNADNPYTVVEMGSDSLGIDGTTLFENGYWGLKKDPTPITTKLNSGAEQQVYGAWIRTNLVQANLVNGKMVYTEAAIKYLAEYMQQIMAVPEQNDDGSYNTYFVTGKTFKEMGISETDNRTLAQAIRDQVEKTSEDERLGTYAEAKIKYESNGLNEYTGITTWYDAAYFLLHNTFNDSTGYGMTPMTTRDNKKVPVYNSLHLVQTTNENQEICYVFNSKYNDTKYDHLIGEIYNTQTSEFVIAQDDGSDTYVRGNPLPDKRFDPLGLSGAGVDLGYGMSGDTYGDMVSDSTADWAEYYDNTNYHLSLEGHAQFIYYEDDNLYFTFTGDDDVYLFINGIRVLDVGAAHSISKVKIRLNDVAALCGLTDGKAYDFDFFYMERHGTAANFGIETNIKIVDPAMVTNKTGYQNGASTGYNGFVDPNKPVAYSFELTNNGEMPLKNLTFTDGDIDVAFSKETITLNSNSNINEMYLYLYNKDGTVKESVPAGQLTEDILKNALADGLGVGEKIGIYGFKYKIPDSKWKYNTFPNTVYTTAIATGDNGSTHNLNGLADWKVQKSELATDPFHVYDWVTRTEKAEDWTSPAGASVTVDKNELIEPITDKNITVPTSAEIVLCSASGNESGVNINPNATLNNDDSITYKSTKPGLDTVYYKVKGMSYDTMVYHFDVYTYGTVDNTYVLDYGLPVELNNTGNNDKSGFLNNDILTVQQNQFGTTSMVKRVDDGSSNYGSFTWVDPSLIYRPNAIIDNTDNVTVTVQILENGATNVTKFTGVNMTQTITTAPANVMYYEENFAEEDVNVITYTGDWKNYVSDDAGTEQSANQTSNYGSDPNYDVDRYVDDFTCADSNGSVKELHVQTTGEVMSFTFVGTGFEILSRTTQGDYAVINVQVLKDGEIVRQKPVITESKGGDLYQIPVISITGLDRGEYTVKVMAAGSTESVNRILYIDGIRIYEPLDEKEEVLYYNPAEAAAEIFEIKKQIGAGKMLYADAEPNDGTGATIIAGKSMIENYNYKGEADFVLIEADSVSEYMSFGPNNELYLDGSATDPLLAFYLIPDDTSDKTVQIGAHRKADSMFAANDAVTIYYGSTADELTDEKYPIPVSSGTEMYYTIDVSNLKEVNGKYLVLLTVDSVTTTLALTNIKLAGYTLAEISLNDLTGVSGTMVAEVANYFALRSLSDVPVEEPVAPTPIINEDLEIASVSLKATKKIKGGDKAENRMMLTVKTTAAAETVVICDASGNALPEDAISQLVRKETGNGKVTFTVVFTAGGKRGEELNYSVTVYDSNGYASVNTETVTVTVK